MKEIKMKKFIIIKLIYIVLIIIFLISAFLPYYSKYYPQFPLPPAPPIIPSTTIYYAGYRELLYGGWPGLAFLVVSVLLLNFGKKDKALIVGALGCALILINIIISTSYWARTLESGFYIGLIFDIGLIGINIFAFVTEESVLVRDVEFQPIIKPKTKLRAKPVVEIKPLRRQVFDFSANTNSWVFARTIEAMGPKRLLFGSDLPEPLDVGLSDRSKHDRLAPLRP